MTLEVMSVPEQAPETGVLRRRWYILSLLSGLVVMQSVIWNAFTPLSRSVLFVFGWKAYFLGTLANTSTLGFFVSFYPWLVATHKFGLRTTCIGFGAILSVVSIINLFCATFSPHEFGSAFLFTQLINGMLTALPFILPTHVSSVWFSKSERAIATSLVAVSSYVGISLSALVGPAVVSQPITFPESNPQNSCCRNDEELKLWNKLHQEIVCLLMGHAGICCLIFFLVFIYFPSRPPRPPCNSATVPRLNVVEGFNSIRRNRSFLFLAVSYGLSAGTALSWISVFDVNLSHLGFTQTETGVTTSLSLLVGFLASLPIAKIAGFLRTRHKTLVVGCRILSALPMIVVLLTTFGAIQMSYQWLTVLICLTVAPLIGSENLFYEMAAELGFPAHEMDASVPLASAFNIFAFIFFILMTMPIGTSWMNVAVCVSTVMSLVCIAFTKMDYLRLQAEADV